MNQTEWEVLKSISDYARECIALANVPFPDGAKQKLESRAEQIKFLRKLLFMHFRFDLVSDDPAIKDAFTSFKRIQKLRSDVATFGDDAAEYRFWQAAAMSVRAASLKYLPAPTADQRTGAVRASTRLLQLSRQTTIFEDAVLTLDKAEQLKLFLEKLSNLSHIRRRRRSDRYSNDRNFIAEISKAVFYIFGDVPPTLIYKLAARHVSNPDKALITKQVKKIKQAMVERRNELNSIS